MFLIFWFLFFLPIFKMQQLKSQNIPLVEFFFYFFWRNQYEKWLSKICNKNISKHTHTRASERARKTKDKFKIFWITNSSKNTKRNGERKLWKLFHALAKKTSWKIVDFQLLVQNCCTFLSVVYFQRLFKFQN